MYRLTILAPLFSLFCCTAEAADTSARELIWAQNNAPPFFITEGPDQGQGFGDPLQRMLEEELPDFHHITRQMPLRRLNQFWKQGANYCFATMIHQDVDADSTYLLSTPNVLYRPHGVIAARDNLRVQEIKTRHPDHHPAYSLSYFFQAPDIRFGFMSNRTFGPQIDALLNAHKDQLEMYDRSDADGLEGLFDMLKVGRVDYLIDYPFVFRHYDRQKAYHGRFQFIPLQENEDDEVWGAIGCSNNRWGEERIAAINVAIRRLIDRQDYRELVVKWHAAEGEEQSYWGRLQHRVAYTSSALNGQTP
jgi:uncharacterized protein (TIGR02285 family)